MATATEKSQYPRAWIFDEDGAEVEGTYLGLGEGPTRGYGDRPFLTLDVDGEPRTVWLLWEALLNQVFDELERRPGNEFVEGETIIVKSLGKRTSGSGREYESFKAHSPDAPKPSGAGLLKRYRPGTEPAEEEEKTAEPADEIPF